MRALLIAIACAACSAHVDGPAEDHAARDRVAGIELAAHLAALPGVIRASAIVHTPWQDPLAAAPALDAHPTASIAITAGAGVDAVRLERDARKLAAAALAADPSALTIAVEPVPDAPALAKLGPFEVAASSRNALAATLLIALAAIAGLAGWIVTIELRRRRR